MDEAIQMADERMAYVTEDEEAVRAYWRRTMALCDYTSSMNYATEKGLAKGRTEERRRLLELLSQGLSIEEIKQSLQ